MTEIFSRTSAIHPGIFLGRALWADSVSPRMNTIASRDQFKPIRIGKNQWWTICNGSANRITAFALVYQQNSTKYKHSETYGGYTRRKKWLRCKVCYKRFLRLVVPSKNEFNYGNTWNRTFLFHKLTLFATRSTLLRFTCWSSKPKYTCLPERRKSQFNMDCKMMDTNS